MMIGKVKYNVLTYEMKFLGRARGDCLRDPKRDEEMRSISDRN